MNEYDCIIPNELAQKLLEKTIKTIDYIHRACTYETGEQAEKGKYGLPIDAWQKLAQLRLACLDLQVGKYPILDMSDL